MQATAVNFLPVLRNFARQIIPPVLATLIAALLIAGFNRAFSGHLVQPRMAAMHAGAGDEDARPAVKTRDMPAVEVATLAEPAVVERIFAKDGDREAGKDQTALKVALASPVIASAPTTTPAPAPVAATPLTVPPAAPRSVQRAPEPPRIAVAPLAPVAAPVVVAAPIAQPAPQYVAPMPQPAPPMQSIAPQGVAQEPPPVITAKPVVTVPDRQQQYSQQPYQQQYSQQPYQQQQQQQVAQQDAAPPAQQRPFDRFVDEMKPSSIFNRMREFGSRIEAVGNDILPTIRQ